MRRSYKPRLAMSTLMMLLLTMTIVLSSGSAAYPAASYQWHRQESGTTGPIHDTVAIDAAHVWAVTGNSEILFFNGSSWSAQASDTGEPLYGIDAVDNNNIWAVGYNGVILHYNGSSWETQESHNLIPISGISALDSSHLWAAGGSGEILFYDGLNWTSQTSPASVSFEGIYALDASHVWAVGGGLGPKAGHGVAYFFDGNAWSEIDTGAGSTLFDVFAMDAQHVWAVGGGGEIRFFDGSSWSGQASNTDVILYGVTVVGGHAFAVGEQGTILYSDDLRTWTASSSGVTNVLRGITGLDSQHLWAVGDDGVILSAELMPAPPFTPTARTWGHDSIGVTAPATTWYLAEGSTGKNEVDSFETWVLLANPGNEAATAHVFYITPDGEKTGPTVELAAGTRKTINVADTLPGEWSVSTRVSSDKPILAERAMYGNKRTWGHDSIGVTAPANAWYLAEGSTGTDQYGSFETWVLLANPGAEKATAHVFYMTPTGERTGPTVELAAGTRKTINVADTVAGEPSVSTRVSSDKPILAERAMYGIYGNKRTWGTDSIGVTAPATTWYLAEGSTGTNQSGSFETWVLLANPGSEKATAQVFYMTPTGERTGPTVELAAGTRKTINVADTLPGEWSVSTRVSSDKPILAERAMYGNKRTWGHDSIGVTAPANTWYLAEGSTGTNQSGSFETWVLVQNPNPNNVNVDLTFMTLSGVVQGPMVAVPANSRMTFNVADYVPNTFEVSTKVVSSGPAGANGVIVERAMYGSGT